MSATTTTHLVRCPGIVCRADVCGGATVEAVYGPRAVTVRPCPSLLEQGWRGDQLVMWHSQALRDLTPASAGGGWRHRDGLVVFRG